MNSISPALPLGHISEFSQKTIVFSFLSYFCFLSVFLTDLFFFFFLPSPLSPSLFHFIPLSSFLSLAHTLTLALALLLSDSCMLAHSQSLPLTFLALLLPSFLLSSSLFICLTSWLCVILLCHVKKRDENSVFGSGRIKANK